MVTVVLLRVGVCNHDGLGVDTGVEPEELVLVAPHGARVNSDLRVLMADNVQLE